MRLLLAVVLGVMLLPQAGLRADEVSINIYANTLKDSAGQPMATSGVVLLVASTNDSVFGNPVAGAFTSGDDIVLARWDLSAFGLPGLLLDSVNNLPFSGGWNSGDPLAIYWFPTLTMLSTSPASGVSYGFYRDSNGVDTSAPWVTPSAGSLVDLKFFTSDAGSTNNSVGSGNASLVVGGGASITNTIKGVISTNGSVLIQFQGTPNATYVVQATTNLASPIVWQNISTNIAGSSDGSFQYLDLQSTNYPARFYRSAQP